MQTILCESIISNKSAKSGANEFSYFNWYKLHHAVFQHPANSLTIATQYVKTKLEIFYNIKIKRQKAKNQL